MALADRWRYQKWHRRHGPPLRGQAEGDDLAHLFRALLKSLHDGGYAVSMGAFSIRSYPQFYKIPYVLWKSSIKKYRDSWFTSEIRECGVTGSIWTFLRTLTF